MEKQTKIPTVFDTTMQQVGEVYARALLGIGQKTNNVDGLLDELNAFVDILEEIPKLNQALRSPRVPVPEKQALVKKCLAGRSSKEFLNFILILVQKGRFECLPAVRRAAAEMHDEMAGRIRAVVTTASEIGSDVQDRLASRLSHLLGKKVLLSAETDPQIIGGVTVRVGDTVYDASVQNQLKQLRNRAAKKAADAIRQSLERFTEA